jgi:hypothetical protein
MPASKASGRCGIDGDAGKASARMLRETSASLSSLIKEARDFPAFRTGANRKLADC